MTGFLFLGRGEREAACGRVQPNCGSDSSPETCHSWALRGENSECAGKVGLWPTPAGLSTNTKRSFPILDRTDGVCIRSARPVLRTDYLPPDDRP